MIPLATKRYFMNNLGLNDKSASTALMDGEASDLLNVQFDTRGAIVKRGGYAKRITGAITGTPTILGGIEFREKGGTTQVVIVCAHATTKIFSDTETPSSWTNRTNSMVITNSATNYACFTHTGDNDALVLTTQTDAPITINNALTATALTIPTDLTGAKYCLWWNNHLVLANVTVSGVAYPLRLYFYNAGVINAVTDSHYVTIPSKDEKITGIAELYGNLYVSTTNEIHQISGTSYDDFSRMQTSSNVGTVSHWSIQNIENNLVFMSPKGIAVFDGIRSTHISDKIQTTLDNLLSSRNIYSQSAHYRKRSQYWLSVTDGTSTHDTVLVYDYLNKSWTKFKGINANCFINTFRSDNTERLYHGDYGGLVYQNDTTDNDNGVAIDGYWKSKAEDFGIDLVKSFRHLMIFMKQQGSYNLSVSYEVDFGGKGSTTTVTMSLAGSASSWGTTVGSMVWGTDRWGGGVVLDSRSNFATSTGRFIRIKFRTNATNTPFTIYGYGIYAQPMGLR